MPPTIDGAQIVLGTARNGDISDPAGTESAHDVLAQETGTASHHHAASFQGTGMGKVIESAGCHGWLSMGGLSEARNVASGSLN
jgi:hypothetical protein